MTVCFLKGETVYLQKFIQGFGWFRGFHKRKLWDRFRIFNIRKPDSADTQFLPLKVERRLVREIAQKLKLSYFAIFYEWEAGPHAPGNTPK